MPILELTPHTCADSFYSIGREQPTSMKLLSNFVPAPDSSDQWVPRPAATLFPGSNIFTPGFVSAQIVIGNRLYGMVSSALNAGKDQPFCYDLVTQALVSISGITAGNTPTSPATTGAWSPPHMELIGVKIIVTHSGFSGVGANFFGVIDTSNAGALTWTSANTATNLLPSVPVWVNQFGGRAYYFCNPVNGQPAVLATDVLDPLTITNPTFVLTFGDNVPLLCGGTLALNNQLGGIIQGLVVFKVGAVNMFQVTGDFALFTTAINSFTVATGTLAPNSVTTTPKGLMFIAPDGLRIVDFQGNVSDPIGVAGSGIAVPFLNSVTPSRIVAASNATTIRISTQNGVTLNNDQQEWCFDFSRGSWHGPHTFPISLITEYGNSFVASPIGIKGVWRSDIIPSVFSTYVENGSSYTCVYRSGRLFERAGLNELSSVKSIFYQGAGVGTTTWTISILDDAENSLSSLGLQFITTQVVWDQFIWGSGASLGASQLLGAIEIPWQFPIVFDHFVIVISTNAALGVRIGKFFMEYQSTGYTAKGPLQGTSSSVFATPPSVPLPPAPPPVVPPPSLDPGLAPLLACMGSTPSSGRQILINNLLVSLRAAGFFTKLDILYVLAAEASDQSLCNWIDPTKFHATNNTASFTIDRGWANGNVFTNWTPSTQAVNYTLNSASGFVWSTINFNSVTQLLPNGGLTLNAGTTGNVNESINDGGFFTPLANPSQSNGLFVIRRPSSSTVDLFNNTTNYASRSDPNAVSTSIPNVNILFNSDATRNISMMGAGANLTNTDIAALHDTFVTYFTAIGCPF